MVANGAADQLLWISEIGYPHGYAFWSESLLANWLEISFDAMRAEPWIGPISWYNFRNKGVEDDTEHHFGLVDRDFTPKLTYEAYKAYIEEATTP